MKFDHLLIEKRTAVLEAWLRAVLETYPAESVRFLAKKKDRFQNPVGYALRTGIEVIYDELIGSFNPDKFRPPLDEIVKIRSVQDFSPSQAVSFVFLLKPAVRQTLGGEIRENQLFGDLLELEGRIDRLAQIAFDSYMASRERLFEIRVEEARNQSIRVIDRLNRRKDDPGVINI